MIMKLSNVRTFTKLYQILKQRLQIYLDFLVWLIHFQVSIQKVQFLENLSIVLIALPNCPHSDL